MQKSEIILIIIAVIAYVICAIVLNIPSYVHIMFAIVLLFALLMVIILKYQQKYENEKISHFMKMTSLILTVVFFALLFAEFIFRHVLFVAYSPLIILIFITSFLGWFFKKEEE